jgi:hypothetical protein
MANVTFHGSHHIVKEARRESIVCILCGACSCHKEAELNQVCPENRDEHTT